MLPSPEAGGRDCSVGSLYPPLRARPCRGGIPLRVDLDQTSDNEDNDPGCDKPNAEYTAVQERRRRAIVLRNHDMSKAMRTLLSGGVFGAALTASRVYYPEVIKDQMRLADFYMVRTFVAAVSSSALVMVALERVTCWRRPVRSNSRLLASSLWDFDGNVAGGALLGLGMSLAGACPGTILVQVAQDVPSARATMFGALLGGICYSRYGRHIHGDDRYTDKPHVMATITDRTHIPEWTILAAFAAVLALLASTDWSNTYSPLSPSTSSPFAGGIFLGAAQAASILLTSNTLGASGIYEQMGRYFWSAFKTRDVPKPAAGSTAIILALGIMAGSAALRILDPTRVPLDTTAMMYVSAWKAILGGFCLSIGAQCAGGCTSGHGLSGVAALSWSSVITVLSIFSAGALSQMILSGL